jgi:acylphosphatase
VGPSPARSDPEPSEVAAALDGGCFELNEIRAEIDVFGVVQGVGYRFFVVDAARSLDLKGCAKNMPDGSVRVVAEGDRGLIEALIDRLKVGPPAAHVRDLRVEWLAFRGDLSEFKISF